MLLKSRMRGDIKSGSVRGFIVTSELPDTTAKMEPGRNISPLNFWQYWKWFISLSPLLSACLP